MIFSATKELQSNMDAARTYKEWKAAAIAYDKATKLHEWKADDESPHFDYDSIRRRLVRLRKLRRIRARYLYDARFCRHVEIEPRP